MLQVLFAISSLTILIPTVAAFLMSQKKSKPFLFLTALSWLCPCMVRDLSFSSGMFSFNNEPYKPIDYVSNCSPCCRMPSHVPMPTPSSTRPYLWIPLSPPSLWPTTLWLLNYITIHGQSHREPYRDFQWLTLDKAPCCSFGVAPLAYAPARPHMDHWRQRPVPLIDHIHTRTSRRPISPIMSR